MRPIWFFLVISLAISLIIIVLAAGGIIPPLFFIVVFLPLAFTGYRKDAAEHYGLRICPQCGAALKGTENYCPICGFRLRFGYEG